MKKVIIALFFLAAVSAGAYAQQKGPREKFDPEKRAEIQTKKMSEELGLNDDQHKKLLALNVERNKKSYELGKEEAAKRKEIRETYVKELDTILTPEQKEKLKSARKEGRREGFKGRGGAGKKTEKSQN